MTYESHAKYLQSCYPRAFARSDGTPYTFTVAFFNELLRHCRVGKITMKPKA